MAREQAVQPLLHRPCALRLLVLALLAVHAVANNTYRDPGAGGVDTRRKGNATSAFQYNWTVQYLNTTRHCSTKPIATINGQFPGPPIYVREGDTVLIQVTNNIDHNVTLHWHGVRQLLQNWQDGPAYFTQCPIQPGQSFTYNFTINDQKKGTVFWHAHITWLRATLYGSFIILPRVNQVYPFATPQAENTLIFGEWWKDDTELIEQIAVRTGGVISISDALTINGQPGDLYNCSAPETTLVKVDAGRTYLFRLVNAAMNYELYFGIANHTMLVVEADGEYTKPYRTSVVLLSPGNTMNVLVTMNQSPGKYYIATSVWSAVPNTTIQFPATPATARLEYNSAPPSSSVSALPQFPVYNDLQWAFDFEENIKSLNTMLHPIDVPKTVDENLFFTVGYSFLNCAPNSDCVLTNGTQRIALSINNNTFFVPKISILQAYYYGINNVYTPDFPDNPPNVWDYTGPNPPTNQVTENATRVNVLKFGSNVQLVLQDTNILFAESHPFHLHGFSFFVVGKGFGNYNPAVDPQSFNLVDPPLRNTIAVPAGGWTAIRWNANNPGVWLMHCHLESHITWGMEMAFIVLNGNGTQQTLPPPPANLPMC